MFVAGAMFAGLLASLAQSKDIRSRWERFWAIIEETMILGMAAIFVGAFLSIFVGT